MSFKKVKDAPKNLKEVLESKGESGDFVQPKISVKKFDDTTNLKKIEGGEVPKEYQPTNTGSVFLGRTNNFTVAGDSAYQIAVKNGFVGTEADWLVSLEGSPGPPGTSGAGYHHVQVAPSTTWTINHNLGYRPSVQIFSVGGLEILGEIQHISDNQTTILFNTEVAGTARLN